MEVVNEPLIAEVDLKNAAKVIRAINHPLRKKLLFLLEQYGELSVTEIYIKLRLEQSVASQHIGDLRDVGIVKAKRDGKYVKYSINHGRLRKVNAFASLMASTKY